jgi:uncharacterized protein (DUF1499 family)
MRRAPPPPVSALARWSLRVASTAALVALIAVAGVWLARLAPAQALVVALSACAGALLALALAAGAAAAIWRDGLRGAGSAAMAALLAIAILAYPAALAARALTLPRLNGASTDPIDPPRYAETPEGLSLRAGRLPPAYPALFAPLQRDAYPDVQPLLIDADLLEATELAKAAALAIGLEPVVTLAPGAEIAGEARIEAIDRSPLLRLEDAVVVRLRETRSGEGAAGETRIDMRSTSLIGAHDLGVNAARIVRFMDALTRLAEAR